MAYEGSIIRLPYGTRTAIVLTAVSMALCALSTTLPMYSIRYYDVIQSGDHTHTIDEAYVFYFDYLQIENRNDVVYPDNHVKEVMDRTLALIMIWLVAGIVYIGSCIVGSRALVRGFIVMAFSVAPVVYFAAKMPWAINEAGYLFFVEDFWGVVRDHPYDGSSRFWSPAFGWFVLALACSIQVAAVIRRNLPMVMTLVNTRRVPREVSVAADESGNE